MHFWVEFCAPSGVKSFLCSDGEYLLDSAEQAGIDMAYFCRMGSCGACVARLIHGVLDQSEQSFLVKEQIEAGYCLLCVSRAESNLILKIECENELWEKFF